MPIRFRCAYCNQLMGIARRKAGTVVSCPTCQGQVVVPIPEAGAEAAPLPFPVPPVPQGGSTGNVFDQQDFDPDLFNPHPAGGFAAPPAPVFSPPRPLPTPAPQHPMEANPEPFALPEPPGPSRSFVLTRAKAGWLAAGAALVGLVLFGLGYIVGKMLS